MRPDWREVRRNVTARWASLYVTMNPKGEIRMSRITYEKLGAPKAVNLLFDTVNSRIGIKPTHPGARNSFHVGLRDGHGGRRISAYQLMAEFHVFLPETIQFFDADFDDDGILILDLRTARISPRAATHPTKRLNPGNSPTTHADPTPDS